MLRPVRVKFCLPPFHRYKRTQNPCRPPLLPCSAFGTQVVDAKALIKGLPAVFGASQNDVRNKAKELTVGWAWGWECNLQAARQRCSNTCVWRASGLVWCAPGQSPQCW